VKKPTGERAQRRRTASAKITKKEINAILAQTDWAKYWRDVAEEAMPEIEAYDRAMVASLAAAAGKFVR
jgi:hypothetical protein